MCAAADDAGIGFFGAAAMLADVSSVDAFRVAAVGRVKKTGMTRSSFADYG